MKKGGRDWPWWLPFLLFAVREVPQASLGFSPFELLYERHPRDILDLVREEWEKSVQGGRQLSKALQKKAKSDFAFNCETEL